MKRIFIFFDWLFCLGKKGCMESRFIDRWIANEIKRLHRRRKFLELRAKATQSKYRNNEDYAQ